MLQVIESRQGPGNKGTILCIILAEKMPSTYAHIWRFFRLVKLYEWQVASTYRTHSTLHPLPIISPPYYLHKFAVQVYPSPIYGPLGHGKSNNGRTLRLRRARGRLKLTVPPYIESSYLLASDTLTKRLAMGWQACS